MERSNINWAAELFRASLRSGDRVFITDDAITTFTDDPGQRIPNDPAKLAYLRRLIASILDGRKITATYNCVLLGILVVLTAVHWTRRLRDKRRWERARSLYNTQADTARDLNPRLLGQRNSSHGDIDNDAPSSSSSSTLEGTASPGSLAKPEDENLERQPLLGLRKTPSSRGNRRRFVDTTASYMMYQPQPIPIINRTLPSNGTSLFVLAYVGLNIFYHLFRCPLGKDYFFAFADRAGCIFVVNLPLLYLLAAKNQPLKFLTGHSYEALNIFHRRVGELMCFESFLHFGGMLVWEIWCSPEWLKFGGILKFLTTKLCLLGIGAFVSYELLFFTSLGSFRRRWYELFLASHVVLQVAALVFLFLHFPTSRLYVTASLIIFLVDRLMWRIGLKSASMDADLHILEDGNTLLLSADWDIPQQQGKLLRWFRQSVLYGWHPMDHVFVTIPSLGRTHALQAHPFTIASAAPVIPSRPHGHPPTHAWLSLLIRAQSGFTGDLLAHSQTHTRVPIRLDGPYGSTEALSMLRAQDTVILIAGGSGIAVVFPLLWALTQDANLRRGMGQQFHLLWVIHSRAHRSWAPQDRLDELADAGVHITVPEPTAEVGRPDVGSYLSAAILRGQGDIGVVVSGPDALNRAARNACAREVRQGANIRLRIEKFGW